MKVVSSQWLVVSLRAFFFALGAMLVALGVSVEAQQPLKVSRIGFVSTSGIPNAPGRQIEAFRQGLQDLGYVEGQNILIEFRFIEGKMDRAAGLIADLVRLKVDVLVVQALTPVRAAKEATKTIPIVMLTSQDPVETGLVDSLASPGGNITGIARLTRDLSGKRLELLKEVVPKLLRVAVLMSENEPGAAIALKEYEEAADTLKVKLLPLGARSPNPDLESAFQEAAKNRSGAVIAITGSLLSANVKRIADLAIKNRLPSMFEARRYVEAGGLMYYSTNDDESFKRAAVYVDKILKGAKPANLPVEQPTKFELVINLKTAKQIGLTIPQSVLYRADKVIK